MTDNNTQFRLTRRRALAGAAWSAPVIVVASAVPAFAASPSTSLVLNRGTSGAILTVDGPDSYYDLNFTGLSVVVPSALAAGQLTLTVTYTPLTAGGPSSMVLLDDPSPIFTIGSTPGGLSVVLTYTGAVPSGGFEVMVPNGIFVGAGQPTATQKGTYVVTAAAPGLTSDTESFATPTARPAQSARAVARPVV